MRSTRHLCSTRLLAILLAAAPAALGAATYNITTLAEDTLDNGNCTLREALLAVADDATHGECVGDPGADEIVLQVEDPSEPYALEQGPIELSGKELVVRGEEAHRPYYYLIDMGSLQRFLSVTSGSDLTLENLTLQNGSAAGLGGAVFADNSDLTMREVHLFDNTAVSGGAIAFQASTPYTLDIEQAEFQFNEAEDQGGAIFVSLLGGGGVRLVDIYFPSNKVVAPLVAAPEGTVERRGGALDLYAQGVVSMELRHLEFVGNEIHAQTDAFGGAAAMFVTGSGGIVAEDIILYSNLLLPLDGSPTPGLDLAGLSLSVFGPSLEFRRLHSIANGFGGGDVDSTQIKIVVGAESDAILSDFLVASGNRSGLALEANGGTCSIVAGNLTVTGLPRNGLSLVQSGTCTLRLENSIVWDNGFGGGGSANLVTSGTTDVDAVANQNMIDNLVDPLFLDVFNQDYRLAAGSPAINSGDQSFDSVGPYDVAHGARVLGANIDIGAYESGAIFNDDFEHGDPYAWSGTTQ